MQLAVVEYARNVCKLEKANSFEFDPETLYPVGRSSPGAKKRYGEKGGTMRLGAYPCVLEKDTFAIARHTG
jgi:CTP synthase